MSSASTKLASIMALSIGPEACLNPSNLCCRPSPCLAEQAATEKASACAPDLSAPESLRVFVPAPEPAPAAAVAAPGAGETPLQARLSTNRLAHRRPERRTFTAKASLACRGNCPQGNKLNGAHTRSMRNGAAKAAMTWLIGSLLKKN